VLIWHYGLRGWGLEKWWKPEDLAALKAALAPYNIALILHGHEHRYDQYEWEGYPVFMAPSPQADRDPNQPETESRPKGFLVVRLVGEQLEVLHRAGSEWKERWTRRIGLGGR
jgi:cytolysin (calcineurin-like family phosphatase)